MDNTENDVLTIEDGVLTKCKADAVNVVIPEGITEIGKEAFYWCESLESVTFPESITTIDDRAFQYCKKLASVTFPESVTTIGNCAFEHCEKITSVVIHDGVKTLGNYAFAQCDSLKSAVIGKGVEKIGFEVFNDCPVLESVVIGENVKEADRYVFSQCESLSDITFGGTLAQWENVKGRLHLLNNEGVKSIKCSDGEWIKPVLYIENGCVLECLDKSAKSVTVPEGITEISFGAFEKCKALESVVISEGVTKLDSLAFCDCTALKSVVIPSTVTKIESSAFDGCEAVEKVVSNAPLFPVDEKKRKLYDATWKRKKAILVLQAAKEEAKKEKIEKVQNVSASAVLESILSAQKNIRPKLRREGKEAYLCLNAGKGGFEVVLEDSKVSKWMQSLPALLDFASTCTDEVALRKYALDNGFEDTSRKFLYVRYGKGKVRADTKPIHIVISDEVTEIQEKGFYECGSLKSVVLPSTVKKIGEKAFADCFNLSSLFIPESVKEICKDAFSSCNSLYEIDFGGTIAQWEAVEKNDVWNNNCHVKTVKCTDGDWKRPVLLIEDGVVVGKLYNKMTSVTIADGVREIRDNALCGCSCLKSVFIPESVKKIGINVFSSCALLSEITFGGTLAQWNAVEKSDDWNKGSCAKNVKCSDGDSTPSVLLIENGVVVAKLRQDLTDVIIPEGVTEIAKKVFDWCVSLKSVALAQSVKIIDYGAFERCSGLESVEIPDGVTEIGREAFHFCDSLKSVVIPQSVTSIGRESFSWCKSLESAVIGANKIGNVAFERCPKLKSVTFSESVKKIGDGIFSGCPELCEITFLGTMKEWNAVKKGKDWNKDSQVKTVKCTDGDAKI